MGTKAGAELELLVEHWLDGGSIAPLLRELCGCGRSVEAAALARVALAGPFGDAGDDAPPSSRGRANQDDAMAVVMAASAAGPDPWSSAVVAFAATPSQENWDALVNQPPGELFFDRDEGTMRLLLRLRVGAQSMLRCATRQGITAEAIALADTGAIASTAFVSLADEAAPEQRAAWLGLAARAAFARGNEDAVVRLLREAFRVSEPEARPFWDLRAIRELAGDALQTQLDSAGIPR